jgi:hypothetical protein
MWGTTRLIPRTWRQFLSPKRRWIFTTLHFGMVIIVTALITSEISSMKSIFMFFNNFMILVKSDVGRPSPFWPPLLYGLCKNYRKLALKFWKNLDAPQLFVRGSKSDKFMFLIARCFEHEDFAWVRTRSTWDMQTYVFRHCGEDRTHRRRL